MKGFKEGGFGAREDLEGSGAGNGGKTFEKFFEGVVILKIFEEGADRDAGAFEDGGAAEGFGVNGDEVRSAHENTLAGKVGAVMLEVMILRGRIIG